jgi:protein-S-isoprenylcysteine O-methyltransferase Ste14
LVYRISVEEKALLEDLGDRYRTYAEHHKRLIPFVW